MPIPTDNNFAKIKFRMHPKDFRFVEIECEGKTLLVRSYELIYNESQRDMELVLKIPLKEVDFKTIDISDKKE